MRKVAGAIVCVLITSVGLAQDGPAAGGHTGRVAVKVVDNGTDHDPNFSDPGNHTARSVAKLHGITVGEARSRLRAQQRSALLVEKLSTQFSETFLGLRFDQGGPVLRIWALFAGGDAPQDAVSDAARAAGMSEFVEVAPAALSRKDERELGKRLMAELRQAGRGDVDFAIDSENGVVTLGAAEDTALQALVFQAGGSLVLNLRFDPDFKIVLTTYSIAGQAWNAPDGDNALCTTGFSVYNTSPTTAAYGATTAGHCYVNTPAEFNPYMNTAYGAASGNGLAFRTDWEWIGNGLDIQFHTLRETGDETAPYYWNGTSSVPVASSFKTEPQPGTSLCKWGRVTGWDCGTVGGRVYHTAYGTDLDDAFYTLRNPNVSMSEPGDSGGPVAIGQQAFGWTHGRLSPTDSTNVFLSIQRVYAKTPLRLTLCVPGTNC